MRKLIMAVVLGLIPAAGQACAYLEPFEMANIPAAELVVVGKVTEFRMIEETWGAALVTVKIDDSLKGDLAGEITFVWNSGMAQGPYEDRTKGTLLIGAAKGGRSLAKDIAPDARPDLPSIIQPYCGEVWMLPASAATVAEARKALE
jgi:hypothetical protein